MQWGLVEVSEAAASGGLLCKPGPPTCPPWPRIALSDASSKKSECLLVDSWESESNLGAILDQGWIIA